MNLYDDVRAILVAPEWEPVNVIDYGAFVTIAGRFNGVAHAGSRADWEGLARDLDRIARERYEAGKAEAKPEPVAEAAPPAVDPRDAELAALRARAEAAEQRVAELESSNYIDRFERPEESPTPPPPSPAVVALDKMEAGGEDDETPGDEPLPDALARLVPHDVEHELRIKYLRDRWQKLTHKLMSPQTFGETSEAERIEHQELERYRGLFT